jgi:hypothetical protein
MTQAYDETRCEHSQLQARCAICLAKNKTKVSHSWPAPSNISGEVPAGIEDVHEAGSLRDKVDGPAPADLVPDWEKPYEEQVFPAKEEVEKVIQATQMEAKKKVFKALPNDDSHASKVMRAAAAFAEASSTWALELANVEKIKADLLVAKALLDKVATEMIRAEKTLKELINGTEELIRPKGQPIYSLEGDNDDVL